MLSKCANPTCFASFRYLRQGRLFKIEKGAIGFDGARSTIHRTEYFWLCERCAKSLEVVVEDGVVSTHPLRLEVPESAVPETLPVKAASAVAGVGAVPGQSSTDAARIEPRRNEIGWNNKTA